MHHSKDSTILNIAAEPNPNTNPIPNPTNSNPNSTFGTVALWNGGPRCRKVNFSELLWQCLVEDSRQTNIIGTLKNVHNYILATPIPSVCQSVRPSVTRVYCIKTDERIIEILSPSDRPIILVFRHQGSLCKSGASPPTGAPNTRG